MEADINHYLHLLSLGVAISRREHQLKYGDCLLSFILNLLNFIKKSYYYQEVVSGALLLWMDPVYLGYQAQLLPVLLETVWDNDLEDNIASLLE